MTATQRPRRLAVGAAPSRRPGGRPLGTPPPRPRAPLRIVRAAELSPAGRRRRRRFVVVGTAALAVVGLFAVVVVHVVLAQQQFQLADLSSRISSEQSANDQLRLQVAQLQAPQRVVSEAEKQLGMVSPPSITYLVPGHTGARVRAQAAGPAAPSPTGGASQGASSSTTTPASATTPTTGPTAGGTSGAGGGQGNGASSSHP